VALAALGGQMEIRMTMTVAVAVTRIERELRQAEAALEEALLKQSQLFATMVAARRDTNVDSTTAHEALMRLNRSQQELLTSGGNLARVHSGLLEVGREVAGLADDCPDNWREIAVEELPAVA
jgi:triphosphoribosyl-dephospho-CoA synthetase